jgi:hypothetical protein
LDADGSLSTKHAVPRPAHEELMPQLPSRPFARYASGGSELLGIPAWGDGTARHGYGRPVFAECGYQCAYCGFEMGAPYEAWLNLSVDHVVPAHLIKAGWPLEWVLDRINLVTCCRACNEFTNGYRLTNVASPATFAEFIAIRDRAFDEKRDLARARHAVERERYVAGRPAGPSDVQEQVAHVTSDAYNLAMAPDKTEATEQPLLSLAQAALELGLSPGTLRNQVLSGKLKAVKLGSDWLVTPAEVERYRQTSLGRRGRPRVVRVSP